MYKYKRVIISVIALLLVFSLLAGFVVMLVSAKTSDEIQDEIDALESKADALAGEREELEDEIAANENVTLDTVAQKAQVDRDIELTRQEVEVVKEQIHQYSLLIAEKQAELDELEVEQTELFTRYKLRMRSLQQRGDISIWDVLLEAETFSDMLAYRVMIEQIARSDQKMLEELRTLAAKVISAKDNLAAEKADLEIKKAELAEAEALLDEKRAESNALLTQLVANKQELVAEAIKYEEAEAELAAEIAKLEDERTEALRQEWLAANPPSSNSGSGSTGNYAPPSDSEGFIFPLPVGIGVVLTSPYGYRTHPITGNYTFHNGVDLAWRQGTPIYASKSGYVTTATWGTAYGYYVTINHMDGFSTLYGHMTHYVVSSGDYVDQGQLIGYMGSTGWSTGPHLHFTIFYEGTSVNPMNYISLQ